MSEECGVSFEADYDDENQLYVETWRRARKPHQCGECKQAIAAGVRYLRVVGKSDGRVWTRLLCEPCNEILHEFTDGSWAFGGYIWEQFDGEWANGTPLQPCLNRLTTVAAKTKLRDMWLAHKGVS
jgi:hypothetical protein